MVDDIDPLAMVIGMRKWSCTQAGWIWYCDVHDTHGNADFEDEARSTAAGRVEWWEADDADEPCDIHVTKVEPSATTEG